MFSNFFKMSNKDNKPKKIVIIGDGAIGKTCFLNRYIKNEYENEENYVPTIFENHNKEVKTSDGETRTIRYMTHL